MLFDVRYGGNLLANGRGVEALRKTRTFGERHRNSAAVHPSECSGYKFSPTRSLVRVLSVSKGRLYLCSGTKPTFALSLSNTLYSDP